KLTVVGWALARLGHVHLGRCGECVLDLDEVGEPFYCGRCLAVVEPRRERVRITPYGRPVEDNVHCPLRARGGPWHDIRVRRVSVHLQWECPRVARVL